MQNEGQNGMSFIRRVEPLGYSNTQNKKSILLSFGDAPPRSVVPSHRMQGRKAPRLLSQKPIIALQKMNFMLDKLWGALYRPL
jgi:hypothetical protein